MNKPVLYPLSLPITQAGSVLDVWLTHHADGRQHHVASGVWRFENGQEFPVSATIRGGVVIARAPVGRPTKTLRNIAAFLASRWYALEENDEAAAVKRVYELWANGHDADPTQWTGASDEREARRLIDAGKSELGATPGALVAYGGGETAPRGGVAWVDRAHLVRSSDGWCIDGPGYWWDVGDEEAVWCDRIVIGPKSS